MALEQDQSMSAEGYGSLQPTTASTTITDVSDLEEISDTEDRKDETLENDRISAPDEEIHRSPQSLLKPPKVCYKIEYRELKDNTLLKTEDRTELRQRAHQGPVFDVVDVNYTSETKDTQRNDQYGGMAYADDDNVSPSVKMAGGQYIRIYSHAIVNALQSVVNYYPYRLVVGDPVDIKEPYAILVHHWEQLEEFREAFNPETATENETDCAVADTYEHLGYLLEFLEHRMGDKVRKERERWAQPVPKASFEMLWLLLRPGIDVYYDEDNNGSREPWILADVTFNIVNQSWPDYAVRVWNLTSDEDTILPDEETYTITRFHGEKPINELDIFPCEYLEGQAEMKQKMIERGKTFFKLRQKKCMYFDGEGDSFPRLSYKGYVMLDPVQEFEDCERETQMPGEAVDQKPSGMPFCFCKRCSSMETEITKPAKFKGYNRIHLEKTEGLTEHQYFICSRATRAFVLSIREWKLLFVSGFSEPKWNSRLIDELVIKPHFKTMLQNLSKMFIEQQQSSSRSKNKTKGTSGPVPRPWTADFVENKGKGLVFLLHGLPGVGKTYTAECIAQYVKRPLLAVTCADIGVGPSEVEENLRRWFRKARRWEAIMLLDEADVYMEYRQIHDLSRNNLVAGFLRAIEYYDGVLFLTTNRIGTFDEAFLSRINVSLYYEKFSEKDRRKIWYNYFDKLERERGNEICVPYGTKEYATESTEVKKLEWNGREIRNAFQIAVNLAQAEGNKDENGRYVVKREHIQVTVELSQDFKDYMLSIHKKTESQRAQLMGYRYDTYNTPSKQMQGFH